MTERRVLVTGASSGIGLATVRHLAGLGFTTMGLVADEADRAAVAAAGQDSGTRVEPVVADLSVPAAAAVVDEVPLYALVNNAGYMNLGLVRDVGLDEARRQFDAMVFAPIDLTLRALPAMLERGEGKIVNVTSAASHAVAPFMGWYLGAKSALRQLTDTLRIELHGTGIDVVDVEPGGVDTGIWARAADELARRRAVSLNPEAYERPLTVTARIRSRTTRPERVASAIGRVLTTSHPPAHVRVGRGALALRLASEVVPDRLSEPVAARLARTG